MEELIKKLIAFESDKNHPQEMKKIIAFCADFLRKSGLKVKIYNFNGNLSLVAAPVLKKHYQYILNGHLDVVPADYPNAFKPTVKNNRLYGRGSSDMKGGVGVMMQIAKELIEEKKELDFALMLNTDEEMGGFNGAKLLLEKEKYSCNCVVIPDGGDNFRLILGEKGVLHIRLEAKGKAAHGSRVWLGDNALDKLIRIYAQIKNKMPVVCKDDNWKPTANLGVLKGGDATNKVPDSALMQLDFRFPRVKDFDRLLNLVKKEAKKEKGIKVEVLSRGAPLVNKPNNKYFKKIQQIAKKHKRNLKVVKEHGASDGRFFSEKGIPVIMTKPIASQPHINDEWIDLKSLPSFYQIIKDFLFSFSDD